MTQISTGGPYIAREVHEAALKVKDGIILELFSRIEELEKRYICKDGKVEPRLKVDPFSGKLIPWSDEQEAFFEPWSKLGLDGKFPLEPGEGWEFLPHDSDREKGDEYWSLYHRRWELSNNRGKTSPPGITVGPYRRRIKPAPLVLEPSSSARMLWYTRGHWAFRVCPVTGTHIRWTEDLETFFKPWMDLGVMDKVPLVPGEGWEFLPHQSPPEYGDEYWYISSEKDLNSEWNKSIEKPEKYRVHSAPDGHTGPYRRRIKGRWHTPMGSPPGTQVLLDKLVKTVPPEVGKRYVCRNGEMTEAMTKRVHSTYPFRANVRGVTRTWMRDGKHDESKVSEYDLIAEYREPSKTVESLKQFADALESGELIKATQIERNETPDGPMHVRTETELKPAESPDDWVEITDPEHVIRKCDQISDYGTQWYGPSDITAALGKHYKNCGFKLVRCRRKNLPPVPTKSSDRCDVCQNWTCASTGTQAGHALGECKVRQDIVWSNDWCGQFAAHPDRYVLPGRAGSRTVTLREYRHTNDEFAWTSASTYLPMITGRTCECEVPE